MIFKIADNVRFLISKDGKYGYFKRNFLGTIEEFSVAGAAIEFVKLLDGKRSLDDILAECCKIFGPDVDPYMISKDIERIFGDLSENGLITLVSSELPDYSEYLKEKQKSN